MGSTPDTVTLPSSEFGNSVSAMLQNDAKPSGTSVIISSGADHLTLDRVTLLALQQHSTDFKLV